MQSESARNPYQAPAVAIEFPVLETEPEPKDGYGQISAEMVQLMREARPWILFLSLLGFAAACACLVFGLAVMTWGSASARVPMWGGLVGFTPLMLAAVYAIPSALLFRMHKAILLLSIEPSSDYFSLVLRNHRNFWRTLGILVAISVGLNAMVVGIIVVSLLSALR